MQSLLTIFNNLGFCSEIFTEIMFTSNVDPSYKISTPKIQKQLAFCFCSSNIVIYAIKWRSARGRIFSFFSRTAGLIISVLCPHAFSPKQSRSILYLEYLGGILGEKLQDQYLFCQSTETQESRDTRVPCMSITGKTKDGSQGYNTTIRETYFRTLQLPCYVKI